MSTVAATSLLDRINHLPTVPSVVRDLMAEFDQPETNVERVVRLVSSDPVIAVKILRLANSAFYGRRGTVNRLQDAVVFVGTHATRNLVMSVGLANSIRFPSSFPKQSFWRYSLHSAVAARYLAASAQQDGGTAFALGLMRAVGEPLAASVHTNDLRAIDAVCPFYDEARTGVERERLGCSYVDISAALAERWHFPEQMVTALRQSQALNHGADATVRMATLVAAGAWVAGQYEAHGDAPPPVSDYIASRLRLAGVAAQVLDEMPPLPKLSDGLESLLS